MSISSILTSLESQVSTVLGADWNELEYVYDLSKNTKTNAEKRYGVGAAAGTSTTGTVKAITVDMSFFVVLTRCFVNRASDENERVLLSSIYDEFETINQNVFQKKLNNANILLVSELDYEAPELIGESAISVKVNFTIKYRNRTT